jgi:hypothetical protein
VINFYHFNKHFVRNKCKLSPNSTIDLDISQIINPKNIVLSLSFINNQHISVVQIKDLIYRITNHNKKEIIVKYNIQYIKPNDPKDDITSQSDFSESIIDLSKSFSNLKSINLNQLEFKKNSNSIKSIEPKILPTFKFKHIDSICYSYLKPKSIEYSLKHIDNFNFDSFKNFNIPLKTNFEIKNFNFDFKLDKPCNKETLVKEKIKYNSITKYHLTIKPNYVIDRKKIGMLTFEKYSRGPVQLLPLSEYLKRSKDLYHVHFYLLTIVAVNLMNDIKEGIEPPVTYEPKNRSKYISYIRDMISLKYVNQFYVMLKGYISLNELIQVVLSYKYLSDDLLVNTLLELCYNIEVDDTFSNAYFKNSQLCQKFVVINDYDWYYGPWFVPIDVLQTVDIQERELINSYGQEQLMGYLLETDFKLIKQSYSKFCDLDINNMLSYFANIKYIHRDYPYLKRTDSHSLLVAKTSINQALQAMTVLWKNKIIHSEVKDYLKQALINEKPLTDEEFLTEILNDSNENKVNNSDSNNVSNNDCTNKKKRKKRNKH